MKQADFMHLAALLRERSGLVLGEEKSYLVQSRLAPIARKWGLRDVESLIRALVQPGAVRNGAAMIDDVVDAMTTNESFFFRDNLPFDQFREVILPALMSARASTRKLRIWSAACSSGQEPYSLAMILHEMGSRLQGWQVDILATDISRAMIARAREGLYTQFEVQRGLPIQRLAKHFTQEGDRWRLNDDLRAMVKFREHNLLEGAHSLGRFDVIFCRNVLIYFDQPTKAKVLATLADALSDDGYLLLGGAETVLGISDRFRGLPGHRGLYGRTGAEIQAAVTAASSAKS